MHASRTPRLRRALRLISVVSIVGITIGAVWFGFAATQESGAQMTAASAMAAMFGTGWSAAYAAITAKLRAADTAHESPAAAAP